MQHLVRTVPVTSVVFVDLIWLVSVFLFCMQENVLLLNHQGDFTKCSSNSIMKGKIQRGFESKVFPLETFGRGVYKGHSPVPEPRACDRRGNGDNRYLHVHNVEVGSDSIDDNPSASVFTKHAVGRWFAVSRLIRIASPRRQAFVGLAHLCRVWRALLRSVLTSLLQSGTSSGRGCCRGLRPLLLPAPLALLRRRRCFVVVDGRGGARRRSSGLL